MIVIAGCIGTLFLMYRLNTHIIIKDTIVTKYNRFRKLNKLVSSQYKNCCLIVYHSISILCVKLWLSFLQSINKSVKTIGKRQYEVSYVINGKLYKMVVKPKRGPRNVLLIHNGEGEDYTDEISPYLGPLEKFHQNEFTPDFFQKEKLVFEYSNGSNKTFCGQDILVV